MSLPERVVHADWGTAPTKRWAAEATLRGAGYHVSPPAIVTDPIATALSARAPALVGFDFPIGVPAAYAEKVGVTSFLDLLPQLGWGEWRDFFSPATTPDEISLRRPFYPLRPGGTAQRHLLAALGFTSMDELRRRCERAHGARRAAEALFWTLGPRQVGRAAIAGWRDMLVPALRGLRVWPFHGPLESLTEQAHVVVCETYPGEFYGHLGLPADKTAAARTAAAPAVRRAAAQLGVEIDERLDAEIERGFANDDAYDAFVGLLGILNVLQGNRDAAPPLEDEVLRVEGWILGQA